MITSPNTENQAWLPMDSAPKDNTEIIILFRSEKGNAVRLCWFHCEAIDAEGVRHGHWDYQDSAPPEGCHDLIGWMPMPPRPEEEA